jgi:hypothetical protein
MAGKIPGRARAISTLDRIDTELQELAAVEDPSIDDTLAKIGPGVVLRGRRLPGGSILVQAATVAGAWVMVSPVSPSNR